VRLGERVRELRLGRRMTQEALAERSGLSYKFIGEIERGKGNPTVETLHSLALGLDLEMDQLFVTPAKSAGPDALYQIRTRDLQSIREALESADALLSRLGPTRRSLRKKPRA
jgi:transcriptional regulator with XRE-family HTH domain